MSKLLAKLFLRQSGGVSSTKAAGWAIALAPFIVALLAKNGIDLDPELVAQILTSLGGLALIVLRDAIKEQPEETEQP